jgi:hypothetical protein
MLARRNTVPLHCAPAEVSPVIASSSDFDSTLQEAREAERQRQRTVQRHEKIVKLKTELQVSLNHGCYATEMHLICVRFEALGWDVCSGIVL